MRDCIPLEVYWDSWQKLWEKQRESQGVTAVDRSMFAARHVTQKLKAQALSEMNAENCLNWMEVIAKFQEVHFHDSQYLPLGCTCRFMMAHQGNMGYLRFGKSLSTRQAWWHDEWSCVAIRHVAGESEVNMGNGSKFCYHFWDRRIYACAHIWKNLFRR